MNNNCETARVSLSTDEIGRHWEHFYLGEHYVFSNQIPNRQSFTTTNPGAVINQRALCLWNTSPAAPNTTQPATTMAAGETGAMGLLMLLCIVVSGIYAWYTKAKPDSTDDYHPMADVPPLPPVYVESDQPPPEPAQGDMAAPPSYGPSTGDDDSRRPSQPAIAMGSSVPWDDDENVGDDTFAHGDGEDETVIDDNLAVVDDSSPYGLDKLRGVSMKQFKDQLNRLGITADSGCFKSVELLQYPGAALFVERRLRAFWQEFGSTRIPHAVYFVFGLQSGGSRSAEFKQQYAEAKLWVTTWFKENLANE